jgi:DNA-binding response OmpR family regulator
LNKESSTDQIKQPKELQRAKGSNSKIILYLGFNGKYICTKMLDFGYNGFSFYTFSSAVLWLKNNLTTNAEMPVAIITDFALPDGNVFQFAQELKKDTNLRSISLIVLANNRSLEDRMKALRVGIDDFYINEFSAKKISQRIEFLEKYKGLTENTTPEIKPNLNSFFPKVRNAGL